MDKTTHSIQMIRRLPRYYAIAEQVQSQSEANISATLIANHLNLEPIVVRKDLEQVGAEGKPRLGFDVSDLLHRIASFMGWDQLNQIVLVGCGDLGSAIMGYSGFVQRGFEFVAGFDVDEAKIGTTIHGKQVLPISKFVNLCQRMHIELGIITVPASQAQSVADMMIEAGIRGIWNFSTAALNVPKHIIVQQEDIITSLVILQKRLQHADENN